MKPSYEPKTSYIGVNDFMRSQAFDVENDEPICLECGCSYVNNGDGLCCSDCRRLDDEFYSAEYDD